jgi:acyl-CoA thioester hydrolase
MSDPTPPEGFRHYTDVRVRFSETDALGVVYHSNYLVYCEVARIEYFRALSDERASVWREGRGYDALIAHASLDYRSSARFDERLRVWLRISKLGRTSYTFEYKLVRDDGTLICDARTVTVAIDRATRKPRPLPEAFVAQVRKFEAISV